MSKEFKCTQCMKKIITEKEDRRHTDYSYGLCEDCKPEPEPEPQLLEPVQPDPLSCPECDFVAKTEFGLKSHMRVHK